MTEDTEAAEDPDQAADRLEAALERIADRLRRRPTVVPPAIAGETPLVQVAAELDVLIDRLRAELSARPD